MYSSQLTNSSGCKWQKEEGRRKRQIDNYAVMIPEKQTYYKLKIKLCLALSK